MQGREDKHNRQRISAYLWRALSKMLKDAVSILVLCRIQPVRLYRFTCTSQEAVYGQPPPDRRLQP